MILSNDKDGKNPNRIRNNTQKMGFNTFSPLITFFQQISDTGLLLTVCWGQAGIHFLLVSHLHFHDSCIFAFNVIAIKYRIYRVQIHT